MSPSPPEGRPHGPPAAGVWAAGGPEARPAGLSASEGAGGAAFVCRRCGVCCRGRGGVYFGRAGLKAAARLLALSPEDFARRFLAPRGEGLWEARSLEGPGRPCAFLEGGESCLIHAAKPPACLSWPFYRGPLGSEAAFREARDACPGLAELTFAAFQADFRARALPAPPRSFGAAALSGPAPAPASPAPNGRGG